MARRSLAALVLFAVSVLALAVVAPAGAGAATRKATKPAPSPTPTPVPAVADPCARTAARVVPVQTAEELTAALAAALPGDRIEVAPGVYQGMFSVTSSGTAEARIALCGSAGAVLEYGMVTYGYVLHVKASHWDIAGLEIRLGQKGAMLDGANANLLTGLHVHTIGDEGVHFRSHSSDNRLHGSVIHDTGKREPFYGEAIYVGSAHSNWCTYTACQPDLSHRNAITDNRTYGLTSEAIDIKEGSRDGLVQGNVFDGTGSRAAAWVDVKGNGWTIRSNQGQVSASNGFMVSLTLSGYGSGNTFIGNVADVRASGYGYLMRGGSVVSCDNVATNAGSGFSNVKCTRL